MQQSPGKTLKNFAYVLLGLGIVGDIIITLGFSTILGITSSASFFLHLLYFFIILLVVFLCFFLVYGFGHLVENSDRIVELLEKNFDDCDEDKDEDEDEDEEYSDLFNKHFS